MYQLVAQDDLGGILAYLDGKLAGWCAVEQRSEVPGHDCVDSTNPNTWAVRCFLVLHAFRGKGIAKALLRAAIAQIESKGDRLSRATLALRNKGLQRSISCRT